MKIEDNGSSDPNWYNLITSEEEDICIFNTKTFFHEKNSRGSTYYVEQYLYNILK